jgi:hypothetical protein
MLSRDGMAGDAAGHGQSQNTQTDAVPGPQFSMARSKYGLTRFAPATERCLGS